jgi:hemolysin activation/secretion protein
MGDRTSIALYSTADFEEQQILQLAHEFRLGSEGLTLGGRFTYAWTKPDIGAAAGAPEITARTLFASFEASYPFVRTQAADIRGAAGLDFVNQRVRFLGPLSNDRVRVAYLRVDANAIDTRHVRMPKWRVAGTLELRKGLDIFNASERCGAACPVGTVTASRLDGDASATAIRFAGMAEYAVSPMLSVAILPRLQYAFDPLLSFEEYSAGAYTIGRGYDPGTIIGDDGAGFQFELRAGRLQPFASTSLVMQPFVFVDQAWVWKKNSALALDHQRLTSVGGGVRATWDDRVRLDMILAVPTRRAGLQTEKGDPRLLITLATRLVPWGGR